MKIVNHTDIPNETVRSIIRAVRPAGIANFDVRISNTERAYAGSFYPIGSGSRASADPFIVVVRVAKTDRAARRFSERDADAYALQMLRRYRRGELEVQP
jgi:hypothetical protein